MQIYYLLNGTDIFLNFCSFLDLAKMSLCQDLRLNCRPTKYIQGVQKLTLPF